MTQEVIRITTEMVEGWIDDWRKERGLPPLVNKTEQYLDPKFNITELFTKYIAKKERERCLNIIKSFWDLRISDGDELLEGIIKAIREQG